MNGAVKVREELEAIRERHGELTPDVVVEYARDPMHPLHDRFQWDDSVAAEQYRRVQARELIRSVRVVYRERDERDPERSVRFYQSVAAGGNGGRVYVPTEEILQSPLMANLLLAQMQRDWQDLHRRYANMAEFRDMIGRFLAGDRPDSAPTSAAV